MNFKVPGLDRVKLAFYLPEPKGTRGKMATWDGESREKPSFSAVGGSLFPFISASVSVFWESHRPETKARLDHE